MRTQMAKEEAMLKECCALQPRLAMPALLLVICAGLLGGCGPGDPVVDRATLWIDDVKRGDLTIQRRGPGSLEEDEGGEMIAVAQIPGPQSFDLAVDQRAHVDTRNGVVEGRVSQVAERVVTGTVAVTIELLEDLPEGSRPGLSVDVTIDIETIEDVLYVGRPAYSESNVETAIFKLVDDGEAAIRVPLQFGAASINLIEVVSGLDEGDEIILSDMSMYDATDRVLLR
jgi:hypothetical protein